MLNCSFNKIFHDFQISERNYKKFRNTIENIRTKSCVRKSEKRNYNIEF